MRYFQTKLYPESDHRNPVHVDCTLRLERVTMGDNTRAVVYRTMNPDLSVHPVYRGYSGVLEYKRIALTRCRLSSHSLAVDRGRGSRLPREQRTCPLDKTSIQDECHVLCFCPLTSAYRMRYDIHPQNITDIMNLAGSEILRASTYVHEVLNHFMSD